MKILQVLTYYRPHISGLTIYVERLSRALVRDGHQVTVFTSQYDDTLPKHEVEDGVTVVRVPTAFRLSKGVIMPMFGPLAWKMVRESDVVHLHLPQFDAPGVAFRGRLFRKPVVLTYHSDLSLPPGAFNRLAVAAVDTMNRIAGTLADAVVAYTDDFANHSPFLSRYVGRKLTVIPPPVELAEATPEEVARFREKNGLKGKRVIGISARLAAEKGIEVLLDALPAILEAHPDTHVLHASPEAIGEQAYAARLAPMLRQHVGYYHMLGPLHGSDLTAFYRNLDCLVLCSLNNTETFGLVQIEAMMNGVPVVASDLPGVRQPVEMTGMGEVTPVGDPVALAGAINRLLSQRRDYSASSQTIAYSFSPNETAAGYLRLFKFLLAGQKGAMTSQTSAYGRLRQMKDSA
jgi:glycosyltransferase involved in cell wall biosynthesis